MIVERLIDLVLITNTVYSEQVVFYGYSNAYTLPSDSNFVIVRDANTNVVSTPIQNFNKITNQLEINNINVVDIIIDYYGEYASVEANKMLMVISSAYGSDFLSENNLSLASVPKLQTLSNDLDRKEYIQRYMLTFSLFTQEFYNIDFDYFTAVDLNILKNVDAIN